MKKFHQIKTVIAGLMLSSSVVPVVNAEDIEIYTTIGGDSVTSNPNIMFVVDTSNSMLTEVPVPPTYDYNVDYPITGTGDCDSTAVYFTDDGNDPDCAGPDHFPLAYLACDHAFKAYDAAGGVDPSHVGPLFMIGTYSDQLARFDSSLNKWNPVSTGSNIVECLADSGTHGGNGGKHWIADTGQAYTGTSPADPEVPHPVWAGGNGHLQLFSGNYLNYLKDTSLTDVPKAYLDQVKSAVEMMVRGNTQVDIGLMRFDRDDSFTEEAGIGASEGGPVLYPILDVGADRNDFYLRLATLDAKSLTPLSETYYEALLYFGGKAADYGNTSNPTNQTGSTHVVDGLKHYVTPITGTCDKNYIVVLSDGEPEKDGLDAARKGVLGGFTTSSCSDVEASASAADDNCLDELAGWAATHDVAVDSTIPAHDGDQHIVTHTIGLNLASGSDARRLMEDTAEAGGGGYFDAANESELIKIFNKIIANILKVDSTFSSPAVSVNAFNRSTHLDDLYFTLFKPADGNHWEGNLKKYKLEFAVDTSDEDGDGDVTERLPFIADRDGAEAVDKLTGFFSSSARSFWSVLIDGKEVSEGGVVGVFPDPTSTEARKVVTFAGAYSETASGSGVYAPSGASGILIATANEFDPTNTANLTDALLNTTAETDAAEELVTGTPYRETLINWAAGKDALGQFGEENTFDDVRPQMGDPLHAEPALVQYGEDADGNPELVAYVATNDGYLHAIDVDDGKELFAFVPQELLPNLKIAMEDNGGNKLYGLDGSVVAWIHDDNGNGIIEVGNDHVYLYFGMRRGGNNIYALDVTNKNAPKLMWVIKGGTGDYAELGQTWSTINVEKIKDGATEKTVLIFGGGYDTAQDSATVRAADSKGRAVFIADASSGARLWSGGVGGDLTLTDMNYSIPARIKPLDISGDGFIDRLYAADTGGQIFRFDIDNTDDIVPLVSSITGGRIVDIGGAAAEDARRFYYPPDVALIDAPDGKYHGLIASSGYRAHPLNEVIHDRIYMIKDRNTSLTSTYTTLTETDLFDVTANLAGGDGADDASRDVELANISAAKGWYIDLDDEANPGSWIGEKGLAEPLILEGVAILTTYTPNITAPTNNCEPNLGLGKVFFLDMIDGTPAFPGDLDVRKDRHKALTRSGIPPSPNVIITKGGEPTLCIGTECSAAELGLGVRKTYWYEVEQ